jgi:ketosteroid isomerase-like protein
MTRRNWMAGLFSAAALGWCGAARGQASNRTLADAVADAERAFAESMAKRDLTAFASHLSKEAVFFSSPDGLQVLRGKEAIVSGWRRYFDGPAAPFSWTPATAQVLDSGTLAMTTGPVRNPSGEVTGRFSSVWRFEPDGKWRVIFDRGCNCGGV